jgi:DNA-directed RNA polymerase specialized sigma24 family protein
MLSPADAQALAQLPPVYAEVLRLREHGEHADAISAQLGIEPEAIEPLVQVARAKLAALVEADAG